jgi:hypothetical protein
LYNRIEAEIQDAMSGLGYSFFHIRGNALEHVKELVRTSDNNVRNVCLVPDEFVEKLQPLISTVTELD